MELVGSVDELGPYYERARIFVAPTRFAAGIALKVCEVAARRRSYRRHGSDCDTARLGRW